MRVYICMYLCSYVQHLCTHLWSVLCRGELDLNTGVYSCACFGPVWVAQADDQACLRVRDDVFPTVTMASSTLNPMANDEDTDDDYDDDDADWRAFVTYSFSEPVVMSLASLKVTATEISTYSSLFAQEQAIAVWGTALSSDMGNVKSDVDGSSIATDYSYSNFSISPNSSNSSLSFSSPPFQAIATAPRLDWLREVPESQSMVYVAALLLPRNETWSADIRVTITPNETGTIYSLRAKHQPAYWQLTASPSDHNQY